jgi:hypothetical protein
MVIGIALVYLVLVLGAGSFYIKRMPEEIGFIKILILSMLVPLDILVFCLNFVLMFFGINIIMNYGLSVTDKDSKK